MSVQSTRGRGGRGGALKRNADEANLTHEELVKRQKNRESAKKHRDKQKKTLKELQKRNKQLEDQKADYMKEDEEVEKLVKQAENLIRKHKLAGCKLPQELEEELKNFSTDSLHPLAKPVNPSIPEGHVQPIKLLVTQAGQSGQQIQVGTLQGIGQVTVNKNHMLSAGTSPVGRGQQESMQFSEQLTPSTALEALELQSPSLSQLTRNVFGVFNDANRHAHSLDKHNSLNRPNLSDTSIFVKGSPILQETQSAMASQFYQVHNDGTVKARSADLLENFEQPEEKQKDDRVLDSGEMSYDYLVGSSSPGAIEDHNGYSYVNELDQTESPQAIVYPLQVQEQTQNEAGIHNLPVLNQDIDYLLFSSNNL